MAVVVNSEHRQCPGDTRFTLRIVREIAAGHVATAVVKIYTSIYSIEPALFGVYAVDLLSRWRALRGFRKTLEDDHD